jgi:ATP-dependent DNA helicase RecQ
MPAADTEIDADAATDPADLAAAERLLAETFGFDAFRPGQAEVVGKLLAGRSVLSVFPTGGGKSLCYQLPALLLDGLTLVVSPLIALMKDQVDALRAQGVAAARLDSSLTADEVFAIYDALDRGELKLLYVAPERLANERFVHRLSQLRIGLLAIDEAHCISEWGHNFRPDYLKLARFAEAQGVGRVLALTATATPAVSKDVRAAFGIAAEDHVQTGFYRPNLELRITPTAARDRQARLLDLLAREVDGPAVVYVTLQRTAELVAQRLSAAGVEARPYHAGLEADERSRVQEAFMAGDLRVVVATIAFGMGIDKADIRAVIHHNLPKSLENYAQEIGRAGRDGLPSRCEVLASADDCATLSNFTYGDTPTAEGLAALVRDLLGRGPEFSVSRYRLSQDHDLRPLVVATALTYLELGGVLAATAPHYTGYKLKPTRPLEEVIEGFDPARQAFLREVFRRAKKGRTWWSLEPADVALAIGEPRERIVAAVGYLEGQGELEVKASGLRHGYRRLQDEVDAGALIADLVAQFARREERDVARVQSLVDLAEHEGCLVRRLLIHFGDDLEADCGHCSRCLGHPAAPLPRAEPRPLGDPERALAQELRAEGHEALAHPRQLARLLCGLPSPQTQRAMLTRDPRFGRLTEWPFPQVLQLAETL